MGEGARIARGLSRLRRLPCIAFAPTQPSSPERIARGFFVVPPSQPARRDLPDERGRARLRPASLTDAQRSITSRSAHRRCGAAQREPCLERVARDSHVRKERFSSNAPVLGTSTRPCPRGHAWRRQPRVRAHAPLRRSPLRARAAGKFARAAGGSPAALRPRRLDRRAVPALPWPGRDG